MQPELLPPGSYQRYKDDTATFLTWLSQAAQACGYSLPASSREKTRQPSTATGKCTTASPIERHATPVKEILAQAKAVAESISPSIWIPDGIARITKRAIETRKRFALRFKDLGINVGSNERHSYFVEALERALNLLSNCKNPSNNSSRPIESPSTTETLSNRFALLEVGACDDAESVSTRYEELSSAAKSKNDAPQIIELDFSEEKDILNDMIIRVMCFFDDLHVIQETLREIWLAYKSGATDLIAATMTTNAALSLVEHAEKELIATWPSNAFLEAYTPQPDYSYQCLVLFFRPQDLLKKNILRGILEELRDPTKSLTSFADYIYADSFWTLVKYTKSLKFNAADNAGLSFTRVPSLRMQCREAREIFTSEKFRQREAEDEALTQLLMDTFLNVDLVNERIAPHLPRLSVVDEFTNAIMKIKQYKLTTHTMFAATIMKDIHRILGADVARPYQELKNLGEKCKDSIRHADPNTPRGHGPYWLQSDTHYVTKIWDFSNYISTWILSDVKTKAIKSTPTSVYDIQPREEEIPSWMGEYFQDDSMLETDQHLGEQWDAFVKAMSQQGVKCVFPASDPLLAFRGNPLICGTLALNLSLLREQAGVALANHHLSLLYTTHLYNALQQKGLLGGSWPEIENVVDTHIDSLFFGSRPKTPEDIFKRFSLRLGLPPSQLRPGNRHNPNAIIRIKGIGGDGSCRKGLSPSCLSLTKTSEVFCKYFERKESMIRSLHAINVLVQKAKPAIRGSRTSNAKTTLDPHHFLADFPKWLSETAASSSIDYIDLTRKCNGLLQAMVDEKVIKFAPSSHNQVGVPAGKKLAQASNSNNVDFPHLVHQILWEDKERKLAEPELKRAKAIILNRSDIEIAGEFVQKYLKDKNLLREVE